MSKEEVTYESLLDAKSKYYTIITERLGEFGTSSKNLVSLDNWRRNEYPDILSKRYEEEKELYITLEELKKLMDWKLRKGKFRPTLKKLIAQNSEEDVKTNSLSAFKLFLESKDKKLEEDEYLKLIKQSLTFLIKLRGVGPATASLILSCLNKITFKSPPFFSDESALFIFNDVNLKLKYSMSEYIKYLKLFYELNSGFVHDFTDLENGAWVLHLKDEFITDEDIADKKHGTEDLAEEDKAPAKKKRNAK